MRKLLTICAVVTIILAVSGAANATVVFNTGTFADVHHSDAGGSVSYMNTADNIEAGTHVNQSEFLPEESAHWGDGYLEGGDIYIVSVVSSLTAGDIVKVDNDYLDRTSSSLPYESFWDPDPYWVSIGDYTHTSGDTILDRLIYVENNGDGTYSMVIGSGEYWLVGGAQSDAETLNDIIGYQLRLTRDIEVFSGATLDSPETSWRGYTYSSSGITGETSIGSVSYDSGDLTTVPEPATIALLGLGGLSLLRRRK